MLDVFQLNSNGSCTKKLNSLPPIPSKMKINRPIKHVEILVGRGGSWAETVHSKHPNDMKHQNIPSSPLHHHHHHYCHLIHPIVNYLSHL
jgi:hypothetical protein